MTVGELVRELRRWDEGREVVVRVVGVCVGVDGVDFTRGSRGEALAVLTPHLELEVAP